MLIYSRTTTLDRHRHAEAAGKAVEVASLVTDVTGLPVSVFVTHFGEPTNTIRWSTRVDSQTELHAATDKLVGNAEYLAWVGANSSYFESAPNDILGQIISSTMTPTPRRYYTLLTAAAVNGKVAEAIEFGVRAQTFVAEATGLATAFMRGVYGPFGTVSWLTGADSMNQLDDLLEMQASNAAYHALVAQAGPLFVPGSGNSGLIEKIN